MTAPWIDRKPRRSAEEQLQRAVVEHLRLRAPKDVLFWHCPNGEARSKATAGRLKAMGVRPGVPDLQVLFPDGTVAFMELKAPGGKLSPAQTDFWVHCDAHGIAYAIAWNLDQAIEILTAWGAIKSGKERP